LVAKQSLLKAGHAAIDPGEVHDRGRGKALRTFEEKVEVLVCPGAFVLRERAFAG
jgi:hypothetical protein